MSQGEVFAALGLLAVFVVICMAVDRWQEGRMRRLLGEDWTE